MALTHIKWTPELIAEQRQRNEERRKRMRYDRMRRLNDTRPPPPPKPMRRTIADRGVVYIVQIRSSYKIGKTNKYQRREKELMKQFRAKSIRVIHLIPTDDMHTLEKELHKRYAIKRIFREFFELDENDLAALMLL